MHVSRCKGLCVYMWLMGAVTSLVRNVQLAAQQMRHISLYGCVVVVGRSLVCRKGGRRLWQMARSVTSSHAIPVGIDVRNWTPVRLLDTTLYILSFIVRQIAPKSRACFIRVSVNPPDLSSQKRSFYPCCLQPVLMLTAGCTIMCISCYLCNGLHSSIS